MFVGIAVICTSLLYILMVYIIYTSKNKMKNLENKIYNFLLRISTLGLLLELCCCFSVYYKDTSSFYSLFNVFCNRLFLVYMLTWFFTFDIYLFFISFLETEEMKKKLKPKRKKIVSILIPIIILCLASVLFLPLYYCNDGTYVYSYGPATNFLFAFAGISVIFGFYCVFKNMKKSNKKKYYPLFVLVSLIVLAMIIRSLNPGLIIINSAFAFVTVVMYFTIENPDLQVLNEISKAKEYAENSNNEKSTFLFRLTQQLREPLKKINTLSKEALIEEDTKDVKDKITEIKYTTNELLELIHGVLDISDMENRKIPIDSRQYQPERLFQELMKKAKIGVKDRPIELRLNYDSTVPKYLMGDSLRIKQIMSSLVENALKYTEKGFIECTVSGVKKHDVCRLIVTIEDSGKGMSTEQMRELFAKKNQNIKEIDDASTSLSFIKTLIDLIGGTITVNSELEKGSKFRVIIDQKIVSEQKNQVTESVEQYEQIYVNQQHILIVTANEQIQVKMKQLLKKYHVSYDIVENGQACLEKIRNKEKYQFIMIDEELPKLSSVHTFEKLKSIEEFDIPVVLMTKHKDIETKDAYINMGFQDTLSIPLTKDNLKGIMEKYIIE